MSRLASIKLSKEIKRYLLVGVSVFILELVVIFSAQAAGASALFAVGLAFWIGLLVSFGLQKFFTFGDNRKKLSLVSLQFLAVTALVFFNFGFTLLFTKVFISLMPAFLCRAFALGITTIWNFALYKTRIFKNQDANIY